MDDSCTVDDVACSSSREVILDLAEALVLPLVLDLDGAHLELMGENWFPPPSDRWHRLAEDFLRHTPTAPDGQDPGARPFLVTAAAFLLAESADLDGMLGRLPQGRRAERIRGKLRTTAHGAEHAATSLLERAHAEPPMLRASAAPFALAAEVPRDRPPVASTDAAEAMELPGHRSRLAVREARHLMASVGAAIDAEEALGSLRHRPVSTAAKVLSLVFVLAIDLPITSWLSIGVVGLDGSPPDPLAVVACVAAAMVATAGVAILPYQLGHDNRAYKTPERQLRWNALPRGAKASLVGVTLLIGVVSAAVLLAVVRSGVFAEQDLLVRLIATAVVFALPVAAGMAFWLAFRDGSLERDALERSSRFLVRRLLAARRAEDRAAAVDRRLRLVRCGAQRERREAQLDELINLAARTLDEPVLGPRGHLLTVAEAVQRHRVLDESLAVEAARGSRRHRRITVREEILGGLVPALLDVPILVPVPLASFGPSTVTTPAAYAAVLVAVIMAVGIASGLRHVGRDQREVKDVDGRLRWRDLGVLSQINLVGIGLLTVLLAVAVFVSTRTVLGPALPSGVTVLLALLAAILLPVTAATMYRTAFRDGSPETDDLAFYARAVEPHLRQRQQLMAWADDLRVELALPATERDVQEPATTSHGASLRMGAVRRIERLATPSVLVGFYVALVAAMLARGALHGPFWPVLPFVTILSMTLIVIGRAWGKHRRRSPQRAGSLAPWLDVLPRLPAHDERLTTGPTSPIAAASRQAAPGRGWIR